MPNSIGICLSIKLQELTIPPIICAFFVGWDGFHWLKSNSIHFSEEFIDFPGRHSGRVSLKTRGCPLVSLYPHPKQGTLNKQTHQDNLQGDVYLASVCVCVSRLWTPLLRSQIQHWGHTYRHLDEFRFVVNISCLVCQFGIWAGTSHYTSNVVTHFRIGNANGSNPRPRWFVPPTAIFGSLIGYTATIQPLSTGWKPHFCWVFGSLVRVEVL